MHPAAVPVGGAACAGRSGAGPEAAALTRFWSGIWVRALAGPASVPTARR
ncbi:hypothetical protein ACFPM0_01120 [Pseudonocardia sulfidoxydans]